MSDMLLCINFFGAEPMKTIFLGISTLLILAGCSTNQPVVQPIVKKEEVKKKRTTRRVSKKKVEVPPLPVPEEDVDTDSLVEQAAAEILGDDAVATASMDETDTDTIAEQTAEEAKKADPAAASAATASTAEADMNSIIEQTAKNWMETLPPQQL